VRLPNLTFNLLSIFIFVTFFSELGHASNFGNLRVGGNLGIGQGGAKSQGQVRVEGPLGFGAYIDYSFDSRFTVGAEHQRSFGSGSTAIGFTGLTGKWYFWTPQPQWLIDSQDVIERPTLIQKNISPYAGLSLGFGQASLPARTSAETDILAVGPYVSIKGGLEYPLTGRWGVRSELVYGTTVGGKGVAEMIHLQFGLYYFL